MHQSMQSRNRNVSATSPYSTLVSKDPRRFKNDDAASKKRHVAFKTHPRRREVRSVVAEMTRGGMSSSSMRDAKQRRLGNQKRIPVAGHWNVQDSEKSTFNDSLDDDDLDEDNREDGNESVDDNTAQENMESTSRNENWESHVTTSDEYDKDEKVNQEGEQGSSTNHWSPHEEEDNDEDESEFDGHEFDNVEEGDAEEYSGNIITDEDENNEGPSNVRI
jgi:hypothetical protein